MTTMNSTSPKEKANELIASVSIKLGYKNYYDGRKKSKRAVTVMVNEILNMDVWDCPHNAEYGKPFWQEVLEEIKKL